MLGRATVLSAVIVCSAWIGLSVAYADSGVIPDTDALPWTDPTHQSPLEVLASQIASSLAGRPVRAYCNGQNDWDTLARNVGFDGSIVWGYVAPPRWYPSLGTYAEHSTYTQLATTDCDHLWRFAKASTKPTKCTAYRTITETQRVKVRYRASAPLRVRHRVNVRGKWVTRTVTGKRFVRKTRVELRTRTAQKQVGPLPCFSQTEPDVTLSAFPGGMRGYAELVFAIQTLAHESGHLLDFTSGKPVISSRAMAESRAECFGMQNIARVATALGASADDAANMQRWYWENYYPTRQLRLPDYWSADCRADGPLDATPRDGLWP